VEADELADDETASWLIGTWTASSDEGSMTFAFGTDRRLTATIAEGRQAAGTIQGQWRIRDGRLTLTVDGQDGDSFPVVRLPDREGRRVARLTPAPPGGKDVLWTRAPDVERDPAHPAWLVGTWSPSGEERRQREVFEPDGQGTRVTLRGDHTVRAVFEWRVDGEAFVVREGGAGESLRLVRLMDADGRPRVRLAPARPGAHARVLERLPGPALGPAYDGPLVGRWVRDVGHLQMRLDLLPDGRYERRRKIGRLPDVEPGTFTVSQGATGLVLRLTSSAGRERALDASLAGKSLRLHDPHGDVAELTLDRTDVDVAPLARGSAARWADVTLATEHQVLRTRQLTPEVRPEPPREGDDAPPPDAHPQDVFRGMQTFQWTREWRRSSEALVARDPATGRWTDLTRPDAAAGLPPGGLAPKTSEAWVFLSHGRVHVSPESRAPSTMEEKGTRVRYGKYALEGSMILVQFDDGSEERLRVVDGGRFLHLDKEILQAFPDPAPPTAEDR
jgi:hypothetical protein